jgi:hypothetical protein
VSARAKRRSDAAPVVLSSGAQGKDTGNQDFEGVAFTLGDDGHRGGLPFLTASQSISIASWISSVSSLLQTAVTLVMDSTQNAVAVATETVCSPQVEQLSIVDYNESNRPA